MLEKVIMNNFRCFSNKEIDIRSNLCVIEGKNGVGKTTILNAISWVLSNTICGDYGDVSTQKNMSVVKPIRLAYRDKVNVAIVVNGVEYKKILKEEYEKNSQKVKGHSCFYEIDKVEVNSTKFYEELYKEFDYTPVIKNLKGLNEVNLLIDGLYALMKLDSKLLRELLIALGCTPTEEEIKKMIPDSIYDEVVSNRNGNNLIDKLMAVKTSLNKTRRDNNSTIKMKEDKVNDYAQAVPFEAQILQDAEETKNRIQMEILKLDNQDKSIRQLELEKALLTAKEKLAKEKEFSRAVIDKRIEVEQANLDRYKEEHNSQCESIKKRYATEINRLKEKIRTSEALILSYNLSISEYKTKIASKEDLIKFYQKQKSDYVNEVATLGVDTFNQHLVECPYCLSEFELNKEEHEAFNKKRLDLRDNKLKSINSLEEDINNLKMAIASYEASIRECEKNLHTANYEKGCATSQLEAQTESLQSDLPSGNFSVFEDRIKALKLKEETFPEIEKEIFDLEKELMDVKNDSHDEIAKKKEALQESLNKIRDVITNEFNHKAQFEAKQNAIQELKDIRKKANDDDERYFLVNDTIEEVIRVINDKATMMLGVQFVLLEQNTSNDNYTSVCYVTYNGVKFEDINTSQKLILGVDFIAKLRQLISDKFNVSVNNLPILIDKLEVLDDVEKIRKGYAIQIIGTKVGNSDEIKIINM